MHESILPFWSLLFLRGIDFFLWFFLESFMMCSMFYCSFNEKREFVVIHYICDIFKLNTFLQRFSSFNLSKWQSRLEILKQSNEWWREENHYMVVETWLSSISAYRLSYWTHPKGEDWWKITEIIVNLINILYRVNCLSCLFPLPMKKVLLSKSACYRLKECHSTWF